MNTIEWGQLNLPENSFTFSGKLRVHPRTITLGASFRECMDDARLAGGHFGLSIFGEQRIGLT